MSKEIWIQGRSDDGVCFAVDGDWDEIDAYQASVLFTIASGTADAPTGEYVRMIFDPKDGREHLGPGWSAQVSQLEEDVDMHPIRVRMAKRGYSVELVIEAPDDVRLAWVREG